MTYENELTSNRIAGEEPLDVCRGGILAHEMGLGKTIQAIAVIALGRDKFLSPGAILSHALKVAKSPMSKHRKLNSASKLCTPSKAKQAPSVCSDDEVSIVNDCSSCVVDDDDDGIGRVCAPDGSASLSCCVAICLGRPDTNTRSKPVDLRLPWFPVYAGHAGRCNYYLQHVEK